MEAYRYVKQKEEKTEIVICWMICHVGLWVLVPQCYLKGTDGFKDGQRSETDRSKAVMSSVLVTHTRARTICNTTHKMRGLGWRSA